MASENAKAVKKTKSQLITELQSRLSTLSLVKIGDEKYTWSYVYLVRCNKYYKIGYASNIDSRFDSFKSSNPYDVSLECAIKVPEAKSMEKTLHNKYLAKKHKREWFRLDYEDIIEIKSFLEENAKQNSKTN